MILETGVGELYRVKRGQTKGEIEGELSTPVNECFEGAVIPVTRCLVHAVAPFETYGGIAAKYGVGEEELKSFNGNRPLYPSSRVFIPK